MNHSADHPQTFRNAVSCPQIIKPQFTVLGQMKLLSFQGIQETQKEMAFRDKTYTSKARFWEPPKTNLVIIHPVSKY